MTRFLDGPAAGVVLELSRAPLLLRVTQDAAGAWDALDQLADRPRPGETVHVYILVSNDGTMHLDYTDKQGRRRGKTLQAATYRHVVEQPAAATVHDMAAWRAWATARQAEMSQAAKE